MPVDEDDSAVTEELPPWQAGQVRSDPGVFSGRARPVVMSDVDLALIDDTDDPSGRREWLRAPDRGEVDGDRRASLASFITHGVVIVMLAIPSMLMVAFGIAVAAR